MNSSRQIFLGLLILGFPVGLAAAQTPPGTLPPAGPVPAQDPGITACATNPCCGSGGSCCPTGLTDLTNCACCTDCCAGRTGLVGGVGLYIIQPYFSNNTAYAIQGVFGRSQTLPIPPGSPGVLADSRIDINHHMDVAPLVWLGYIGANGLGVRGRWWTFRQGTDQTAPMSGGTPTSGTLAISAAPLGLTLVSGSGMEVTSKLQLQVADIEALNDIRVGGWDLLFAGGLRIARIDQAYNAYIPQSNANALYSSNTFSGAGPTLALEARHALGSWGLSFYSSARGSLVFGSAHQFAVEPNPAPDSANTNQAAADHRDRSVPIGAFELGLEYGQNVGQARWFGQIGLVGQEWFGAGSASRSSLNVVPGGSVAQGAYVGDSDLAFLGLAIRFGLNY